MSNRWDMMSPKKRNDKTFWVKVGTAWNGDKGIRLDFDSLPLPDAEGRCSVFLFEPREQGGGGGRGNTPRGGSQPPADDFGDDVPFLRGDGIF